jgi:hypothetical protein
VNGTTTLVQQVMLGMEPYVLIRLSHDDDGEESIKFSAGGGVESPAEMVAVIAFALAEVLDEADSDRPEAIAVRDALDAMLKAIEDSEPTEPAS